MSLLGNSYVVFQFFCGCQFPHLYNGEHTHLDGNLEQLDINNTSSMSVSIS